MTEIIIMVVARNLRQRRKKAGLTQKMVACLLGLESATICRMEKGHNAVSLKRLQQFADLYGCTVIDFLQPRKSSCRTHAPLSPKPLSTRLSPLLCHWQLLPPPRRPDPPGMKQSGFFARRSQRNADPINLSSTHIS